MNKSVVPVMQNNGQKHDTQRFVKPMSNDVVRLQLNSTRNVYVCVCVCAFSPVVSWTYALAKCDAVRE